jgi:PAS domain S-box-containing protein
MTKQNSLTDVKAQSQLHALQQENKRLKGELKRHKALFNQSPNAIFFLSDTGQILDLNTQVAKFVGQKKEELLGENFFKKNILSFKKWRDILLKLDHLVKTGEPLHSLQSSIKTKTGRTIDFEISARLVKMDSRTRGIIVILERQENGKSRRAFGTCFDISERIRRIEIHDTLLSTLLQGLLILQNSKIVFCNQTLVNLIGYTLDELKKLDFEKIMNIVHPEDRQAALQRIQELQKDNIVQNQAELRIIRKDGQIRWITILVRKIQFENQPAIFSTIIDITEQKLAEIALLREKEKAQSYLDIAVIILVALDKNQKVTLINRKGCEIFGYKQNEIIGKNWFDKFLPEDREETRAGFEKYIGGDYGSMSSHENLILTKSGHKRLIAWSNTLLRDDDGNVIGTLSSGQDITESRKANAALRASEARFRALFHHSPIGIAQLDMKGHVLEGNSALRNMLGYSAEEFVQTAFFDYTHPEDAPVNRQLFEELINGNRDTYHIEKRYIHKNGSQVWADVNVAMVRNESGEPDFIIGIAQDITKRMKAEAALRESEELFSTFMDFLPVSAFIKDHNSRLLYVNRYVKETFGSPDWQNKTPMEIFPQAAAEKMMQDDQKALRLGDQILIEKLVDKSGIERTFETHKFPITSVDKPRLLGGFSLDITDRMKIEEALRKSEATMRGIFHAAPLGLGIIKNRIFYLVNDKMCQITGYAKKELLEQSARTLYETEEEFIRVGEEKYKDIAIKGIGVIETQFKKKNGQLIDVYLSTAPLDPSNTSLGYAFSVTDITDRKQAERELLKAQALLAAAIEQSPTGILIADAPDAKIRIANSAALEIRGETNVPLTNIPFSLHSQNWQTFHPDGTAFTNEELPLTQAVLHGKTSKNIDLIIRSSNDRQRRILTNAAPVCNQLGEIVAGVAVFSDITERIRAEEELKASELRFRKLFEESPIAIGLVDLQGRLQQSNPALCKMLGYTSEALAGMSLSQFTHKDDREKDQKLLQELFSCKIDSYKNELRLLKKNGQMIWASLTVSVISDQTGKILCGLVMLEDITQQKQDFENLLKSRLQLRALARHLQTIREDERGAIAREIHDELGQVLTALKIDLSLIGTEIKNEEKLNLSKLADDIVIMQSLIDATIKKVRRLIAELRPETLDNLGLVPAIESQIKEFQSRSRIRCELRINVKELVLDKEREMAIFRIIQEALTNITRHAQAKTVNIILSEKAKHIFLMITDDGVGFSNDALDNTKTFGILGMKERAVVFGGSCIIKSQPGKGTVVSVILPKEK